VTKSQSLRGRDRDIAARHAADALGASNPASAADLAEQLAAVEARALTAEDQLARERAEHVEHASEMEAKVRKLHPWIQNLRIEVQEAHDERDRLLERLNTATGSLADGAQAEINALRAERDAALADVTTLTRRLEAETADQDRVWTRRLEEVEAARSDTARRLEAAEHAALKGRKGTAEVKQLQAELEAAHQTASAHKAVARVAQENAEALTERLELLESAQSEVVGNQEKNLREVERVGEKLNRRTLDLMEARSATEDLRDQLAKIQTEKDELEASVGSLKGDAAAVSVAREQAEEARKQIEELRTAAAESAQAYAKLDEECGVARQAAKSARDEVDAAAGVHDSARSDAERLRAELEEVRERAERLEEAAEESVAEAETVATRLASQQAQQREAVARISDLEEELAAARALSETSEIVESELRELEKLRSEVECGRSAIATLQSQNDSLNEEARLLRAEFDERVAAVEASRESAIEAVRTRAEAEMVELRTHAGEFEATLTDLKAEIASRTGIDEVELQRIRAGVCAALGAGMQRLLDGMEKVLGADMALPAMGATEASSADVPEVNDLISELEELRGDADEPAKSVGKSSPKGGRKARGKPKGRGKAKAGTKAAAELDVDVVATGDPAAPAPIVQAEGEPGTDE